MWNFNDAEHNGKRGPPFIAAALEECLVHADKFINAYFGCTASNDAFQEHMYDDNWRRTAEKLLARVENSHVPVFEMRAFYKHELEKNMRGESDSLERKKRVSVLTSWTIHLLVGAPA